MKGICNICGRPAIFHKDRISKKLICWKCRSKDSSTYEICSKCGENRPVQIRNKRNKVTCPNCVRMAKARHRRCFSCGKKKRVARDHSSRQLICPNCRLKNFPLRICLGCGEEKIIKAINLCDTCYQRQRRRARRAT